ncbi:MAG: hypothetical protein OHK0038_19970 [Flammeovirgaceae bacterium]
MRQVAAFWAVLLSCVFVNQSFAQLEELNQRLQNTQNEAEKPILLNKIAEEEILKNNFESSLKHAQEAVSIAQKYKLDEQEMYGNLNISKYYKYKRQFATALDFALKALRIAEKKGKKQDKYVCLTETAFLYQDWNAYEKVVEYLESAFAVAKEMNDKQKEVDIANLIGLSYLNLGKPKEALKYFMIVKDNLKDSNDQSAYVSSLRRLTDIYQRIGDYENALKYNQEILDIKQRLNDLAGAATQLNYIGFLYKQLNRENEALKVFEDAVKLNRELKRPEKDNTSLLINIGVINQNKGNLNKALSTFQEVLNIAKLSGDAGDIANADKYVATTYISMGDFSNAKKYMEDAISNAKIAGRTDILESGYKRLAQIHKLAGNTKKALDTFEEYVQLKDSLVEIERRKQAEQIAKSADAEKQESKLRLLQMDQEMQQLTLQNLQMEAKRKEQELELQAQKLSLLERDKSLQEAKLKQEQLERSKLEQDLLLARQHLDAEQRAQEIDRLQKESELRELTLKQKEEEEVRRKKEVEFLEAQRAMQEEKLKDEQQLRYAFYAIIALSITGLFSVFYGFVKNKQKNKKLAAQNLEIIKQKDEISNQRDEIEKAYSNIQILNEFGQKITAKLNFEAINWTVFAYVNSFMDAAACGVGIYKPKENLIEFKGFIDNGTTIPSFVRNMNDGGSLAVWSLKNKKVLFMNDFEAEKDKYLTEEFKIHGVRQRPDSVICVPLKVEEKYIGVFMIWSFKKNAYEPKDLTILQTLASYISIALDNANAYEVIKSKNQSITDSIRYGQTIQKAILPDPNKMKQTFEDQFIIFKPKDIVSGDYYWFTHISGEEIQRYMPEKRLKSLTFIAAVDCTGHGVPGAFMSMIGNTLLNEIVNLQHIFDPAKILELLNDGIVEALRQEDKSNDDGMDVCLCMIERNATQVAKISYAGAKRMLYYIENGSTELKEIKGDNIMIGGLIKQKNRKFNNQELVLEKGSVLYLSTDGLVDQNNESRKKFGTTRLKQMLEQLSTSSMSEQKQALETALEEHQGNAEQRDDITFIGVRI